MADARCRGCTGFKPVVFLSLHMMTQPSVIVTTYNSPSRLARVLDAYRTQTVPPGEVIVADDGSTDDTRDVVSQAGVSCDFPLRHVWHQDLGFRAAKIRNEAAKETCGEYLILSDGDCIPHPRFIADHIRLARKGTFVQGRRVLVGQSIADTFDCQQDKMISRCLNGELSGWYHLLPVPGFCLTKKDIRGVKTCNFGVYRDDLFAVNGFNEDFIGWGREDSELAVRLMKYGLVRRDALLCATVFHLWHPENQRDSLPRNDEILEASMESPDFRCRNGLEKLE